MSMALVFRLIYCFLASLHLNDTYSVIRNIGFLKSSYLDFILIHARLILFPSLAFLTSFHNSYVSPRLFKVVLKSTSPIRSSLQPFSADFIISSFSLSIFSFFFSFLLRGTSHVLNTS